MLLFTTLFLGYLWPMIATGSVVEPHDVVNAAGTFGGDLVSDPNYVVTLAARTFTVSL